MNSVRWMSMAASAALTWAGSVESRMCSSGKPGQLAERPPNHLRPQARAAHPQQQHVREPAGAHGLRHLAEPLGVRQLVVGDPQPAQPLRLVAAAPQGWIALPEAANVPRGLPVGQRAGDGGAHRNRQRVREAIDALGLHVAALFFDGVQQLLEGGREQANAVGQQPVGHVLKVDAQLDQRRHRVTRALGVFQQAGARPPVIAKGVQRRGG